MYSSGQEFYDFPLEQSLRFNDDDNAYLSRTFSSGGNRKTFTLSFWYKRSNLTEQQIFTSGSSSAGFVLANNQLEVFNYSGAYQIRVRPLRQLRDTGSWYHIVVKIDTTQATASDRVQIYINGELETSFTHSTYPSQNYDTLFNNTTTHRIGQNVSGGQDVDGYLAEFNFIDGQALDPTSFGEFKSGIWIPKDPTGLTYGTNGFRLNFADTVEASGFNALTYTGNQSNLSVNGCGFSPDLVWIKSRTNAYNHELYDTVRGVQKALQSSTTNAETTETQGLLSFDSDGFSVGSRININEANDQHVAWCWDAGSGSPVSNTNGSITSTVKANTDYGFSIATFTGTGANATVGHGLGQTPDAVIVKQRSAAGNHWVVWTNALSGTQFLYLDGTNSTNTNANIWNSTTPTSSVFSVGSDAQTNGSGNNLVAYCFAEKTGFSSISSYTGDGTTDGSKTITTGFKPAFVMMKNASTGSTNWLMFDNTRDTKPTIELELNANNSNVEGNNGRDVTFTDTGFTVAGNNNINGSGDTYIYMAFADTRDAAFWRDVSGQGNDWQPNNLTFSDVVPDAPSNNFATINNLASLGGMTFSEGNTKVRHADIAAFNHARSTMGMTSGKWYWEWYNSGSSGDAPALLSGIVNDNVPVSTSNGYVGQNTNSYGWNGTSGERYYNATNIGTIAIPTGDSSGIYMVAYDADSGSLYFGKNGTWANSGNPATGTGAFWTGIDTDTTWYPAGYTINNDAGRWREVVVNHGQDSTFAGNKAAGGNVDENGYGDFAYAPPSGFLSLCSANLPSGAIDTLADETPEDYFGTVLYTGNGTTGHAITGLSFQPSWTWIKARNTARNNNVFDAVRGVGNIMRTNMTAAEVNTNPDILSSFDSGGFTLGETTEGYGVNMNGETYAAWNWKAGGAGVSNTDGSITSTVSVGATSQQNWFSIVSYTGTGANATVGHGLGVAPQLYIVKYRNAAGDWKVYSEDVGNTYQGFLNDPSAFQNTGATIWNNTSPTSSVFSIGTNGGVNTNGGNYVAYCFANAEGMCKVGSYIGNGSTDGTFVYTGFRPSFLCYKRTDAADSVGWITVDAERNTYNVLGDYLSACQSQAESFVTIVDFLSNGFKMRISGADGNVSGGSYIFLALSEQQFKYANAR